MPPQTRYSLRQAAAAPPKGTTPPKAAPPKNTAPPLPPSPAPLTPDLQARLTTYITTIRSKHLKTPPTPRHANWTTIIAYALTLTTAAEATQFLAHAQRPGSNSASITVWISLIQRHEFDAIKRTDPPTPLQRATIESRLRDYAPGEQLASLWALYERVEEVPLRHAAEQGGTLRKRVWEELGKWQANVQRLDGFCPDMWMVVVCLLASVLMPGFLPSRFARGECRGKFDLEKVREELVRLLRRVAEVGEEEVLGWSNRVLEEWVEGVAEEDGGILTYWLVFGDSPEGMREEREAEERKEREEAEAEEREEREEEEMLVVLRERWARDEAADKEMRQRGLVPQRDIEDQESRDFFQLPLPLPDVGQYGQLVCTVHHHPAAAQLSY